MQQHSRAPPHAEAVLPPAEAAGPRVKFEDEPKGRGLRRLGSGLGALPTAAVRAVGVLADSGNHGRQVRHPPRPRRERGLAGDGASKSGPELVRCRRGVS